MKGTVEFKEVFRPVKVEIIIESKEDLKNFLSVFGKATFCYHVFTKLQQIEQEVV